MIVPLSITIPVDQADRGFLGGYLTGAEGEVHGRPVIISLTHLELHIAFSHAGVPAVAVNLIDIVRAATAAHSKALFGPPLARGRK